MPTPEAGAAGRASELARLEALRTELARTRRIAVIVAAGGLVALIVAVWLLYVLR